MAEEYTFFFTAGSDGDHLFSRDLAALAAKLDLPPPEFRGNNLVSVPGLPRFEIETRIQGRPIAPVTEDLVYVQKYINWRTGLEMAMYDAMSRICYRYRAALPSDSFR